MSSEAVINAPLVLKELPELACFSSFAELLAALPTFLFAQIPSSITNVFISNTQPLEADRFSLWFRLNNAGDFIGIYVFSDGTWRQMFPAPNEIFWVYGDSRDVAPGYILADEENTALPAGLGAKLKTHWIFDATNTFYQYFQVTYSGL